MRKEEITIEKIQLYIPPVFALQGNYSKVSKADVKVVGVKKNSVEYFSGYQEENKTHIDQIVTEDFCVYDLHLDFEANLLTFYLVHEGKYNQIKVLEKVFETFFVEYNSSFFGYFAFPKRKNRPTTKRK